MILSSSRPSISLDNYRSKIEFYHRMLLNQSADWSRGEINVMPGLIEFFWTPDIIIYDLVSFTKPKMLNEVAALEIIQDHSVYYKVR